MAEPTSEQALVFDGDCAFCSSTARFLRRWVRTDASIVAWQRADLDVLGLTKDECEQAVQWVGPRRRSSGALAFAHFLRSARAPWAYVGVVLALPPIQLVARPAYAWIARNRHRMPGGTPECKMRD